MKFGKWVLAACLPLALASCRGSDGSDSAERYRNFFLGKGFTLDPRPPSPPSMQSVIDKSTNLEMTDRYTELFRLWFDCSGTVCTGEGGHTIRLTEYHANFLTDPNLTGPSHFGDVPTTFSMVRKSGHHSGYYSIRFSEAGTGGYIESWSAAFGGPERKPTLSATWTGEMGGHEVRTGRRLNGKSTVKYSFGNNTVNVRLYDISGSGYFGDRELLYRNMRVNEAGAFYYCEYYIGDACKIPDDGNVAGNFYGPNAEETTGIFENGTLAGAWFADR